MSEPRPADVVQPTRCIIPDCNAKCHARQMCRRCYHRERKRAHRGTSNYLTADNIGTKTIAEVAEDDIDDYEFLVASGESLDHALTRVGLCGRSMIRRYQALGRRVPDGLWTAAQKRIATPAHQVNQH